MITKNEIASLNLSPTKKDFVQIWNELLEVASKLSERWDPTSTNESDPGIVILKALTGIADKLNYNIDKNTLEAFMPTAAQEESMRKLCDMLGYNIKYYQSAKTDVTIKYYNPEPDSNEVSAMKAPGQLIPKFTVITNSDQDISYFTINDNAIYISSEEPSKTITCMEGQVVKCESINDNKVITINQISENNRFYLPETQVAENGIFIYNVFNGESVGLNDIGLVDGTPWKKVDNLNIQTSGSKVYKFGFDSYEGRPYIEFPEDYSELFEEGLFIYYTRTSGVNGNVSPRTLTQIELPTTGDWSSVSSESFSVENVFAATTGSNPETIGQAYSNFKKTVGTFETLVTCRDYMNKIYLMVDSLNKPLVSNILVTDIRNDLNSAITICSCDDAGIFYKETPLTATTEEEVALNNTKPVFNNNNGYWALGSADGMRLTKSNFIVSNSSDFSSELSGDVFVSDGYWSIAQGDKIFKTNLPATTHVNTEEPLIDHFDLVFYPFKSYNQIRNNVKDIRKVYDSSFTYTSSNLADIKLGLEESQTKTIAHNIVTPEDLKAKLDDGIVTNINNYLRLNAIIATNSKLTSEEGKLVIENVKIALANAFNMRELDFGEEIPFDSIVSVIEKADANIKVVSLNEPALYTTYSVYTGTDENNAPKTVEYAVASEWLSEDIGRFVDAQGNTTFDTDEAKKIYNKLAVRNVLAGRVPLFNYNSTFKSSFSESAYQKINNNPTIPEDIQKYIIPDSSNPFTVYTKGNSTYIGQYVEGAEPIYQEISTPEEFEGLVDGNIITSVDGQAITDIITNCSIFTDDGEISDITLSDGEYIKFRAPNFVTKKTYPAYVNYNLDLQRDRLIEAVPAEATSLFEVLDYDRLTYSTGATPRWQKVLDYFGGLDTATGSSYKKKFILEQSVSAYTPSEENEEDFCIQHEGGHEKGADGKCKYCGISLQDNIQVGNIVVNVENNSTEVLEYTPETYMALSGCVKLLNEDFQANLTWTPADGEVVPSEEVPLTIKLGFSNPYITSLDVLSNIQAAVTGAIEERRGMINEITGQPFLPTTCSWTVSFEFECVPFEAKSLNAWEEFIRTCGEQALGFKPVEENSTIFWRLFGEGYDIGKYVTIDSEKLLKFTKSYFSSLPETYLRGIYLAKTLGADSQPAIINNNEEYRLGANERLYIEYTPSTTNEDGTTSEAESKTEVYGEGTIIRPSGFEVGLMDSTAYTALGTQPHKTVTFKTSDNGSRQVPMHRFGANEQVEIRDYAEVTLDKSSLKDSSEIYLYKNFNDCEELEGTPKYEAGVRVPSTYTLKDGEYIFYTDKNKAELAYFTSGTQVTLEGSIVLKQFDIIDIADIFDLGLQEIPWQRYNLANNDRIIFQEYQYITLGPKDTLKELTLVSADTNTLTGHWQPCDKVKYTLASDPDSVEDLHAISIPGREGNGWEVCSLLELDVSPDSEQVLRKTAQIQTSITLQGASTGGAGGVTKTIEPIDEDHPLSFKTNLSCQAGGNKINIDNIYYNPNNLKGFELKVFAKRDPAIVETAPGKVVPFDKTKTDFTNWPGMPIDTKEYQGLWNQVELKSIKPGTDRDNALRLPISVIPNTYGIFCIYLHYTGDEALSRAKTWIEFIPGTLAKDVSILNYDNNDIQKEYLDAKETQISKIYLKSGINCIRVANNNTLFIKTSNEAQGILYFDDIRLVNSNVVEYADASGSLKSTTQGLNLGQIGYLGIDSDYVDIDKATADKTKSELADNVYKQIDEIQQELSSSFSANYNSLTELSEKVDDLIAAEESIIAEITDLDSNSQRISKLCEVYNKICTTLRNEEILQKALNNNKNIDSLESQLGNLLESFATSYNVDTLYNQLYSELEAIKVKIISDAEKSSLSSISDGTLVLDDIKDLDEPSRQAVVDELIKLTSIKIEEDFNNKISELSANLNQIVSSDERVELINLLTNLAAKDTTSSRLRLLNAISTLKAALSQNSLSALLVEIDTAKNNNDNDKLLTLLTDLRVVVESNSLIDLQSLADELEAAVEAGNDSHAQEILNSVVTTSVGGTEFEVTLAEISKSTLIAYIDDAIKAIHDGETPSIHGSVEQLISNATTANTNQIKKIIKEIKSHVDAVVLTSKSVMSLMNDLESKYDVHTADVLDKITKAKAQRSAYFESLKTFNIDSYGDNSCKDLAAMAALELINDYWTEHLKLRVSSYLDSSLGAKIEEALDLINQETLFTEDNIAELRNELTSVFNNAPTKLIGRLSQHSTFAQFFDDKVEPMLISYLRDTSSSSLAKTISQLIPMSGSVAAAMEDTLVKVDNSTISSIIKELLDTSNTITVARKQQLTQQLLAELDRDITINNQLFDIVISLLCPKSAEISSTVYASNSFYVKLREHVKPLVDILQSKNIELSSSALDAIIRDTLYKKEYMYLESYFTEDKDIADHLKLDKEALKTALVNKEFSLNVALLPDCVGEYLAALAELATDDINIANDIERITAAGPLVELEHDDLDSLIGSTRNDSIKQSLQGLYNVVSYLSNSIQVGDEFRSAYNTLKLENRLLADIRAIDTNHEFYYNVPVESSVAIDFNEGDSKLNTLMNPLTNYDINNMNNGFVISKLDIDYLSSGLQISRSSRLN